MITKTRIPASGVLLISEPSLQDFYFRRSVVLLAEHNEEGSFGLILNKPVQIRLNEIIKDFPDFAARVFLGGPVKTDSLFFIHTVPELIQDSLKILEGVYWGGDIDQVRELIYSGMLQPHEIRFYIGYSGWAPNQLKEELEAKSWIMSKTDKDHVITGQPEEMWSEILRILGGDYMLWVNFPNDPSLN